MPPEAISRARWYGPAIPLLAIGTAAGVAEELANANSSIFGLTGGNVAAFLMRAPDTFSRTAVVDSSASLSSRSSRFAMRFMCVGRPILEPPTPGRLAQDP